MNIPTIARSISQFVPDNSSTRGLSKVYNAALTDELSVRHNLFFEDVLILDKWTLIDKYINNPSTIVYLYGIYPNECREKFKGTKLAILFAKEYIRSSNEMKDNIQFSTNIAKILYNLGESVLVDQMMASGTHTKLMREYVNSVKLVATYETLPMLDASSDYYSIANHYYKNDFKDKLRLEDYPRLLTSYAKGKEESTRERILGILSELRGDKISVIKYMRHQFIFIETNDEFNRVLKFVESIPIQEYVNLNLSSKDTGKFTASLPGFIDDMLTLSLKFSNINFIMRLVTTLLNSDSGFYFSGNHTKDRIEGNYSTVLTILRELRINQIVGLDYLFLWGYTHCVPEIMEEISEGYTTEMRKKEYSDTWLGALLYQNVIPMITYEFVTPERMQRILNVIDHHRSSGMMTDIDERIYQTFFNDMIKTNRIDLIPLITPFIKDGYTFKDTIVIKNVKDVDMYNKFTVAFNNPILCLTPFAFQLMKSRNMKIDFSNTEDQISIYYLTRDPSSIKDDGSALYRIVIDEMDKKFLIKN
jgi:hypothetical protein